MEKQHSGAFSPLKNGELQNVAHEIMRIENNIFLSSLSSHIIMQKWKLFKLTE